MCTVTYIPKAEGYYFTSNRDEAPFRAARQMITKKIGEKQVLFPQDDLAKGTWIAVSDQEQLVCILNGAFERHQRLPPYRLSRGIMALSFFEYTNAEAFFKTFNFEGIEPFTMVILDSGKLYDFRWNGIAKFVDELPIHKKHIWSSCTLYPPEWQQKREHWFSEWSQQQKVISQEDILYFHKTGGEGNEAFDLVMNRENRVRTVSISAIEKTNRGFDFLLHNITSKQEFNNTIHFS